MTHSSGLAQELKFTVLLTNGTINHHHAHLCDNRTQKFTKVVLQYQLLSCEVSCAIHTLYGIGIHLRLCRYQSYIHE